MKYNQILLDLYKCRCGKSKLLSKSFVKKIGLEALYKMRMHKFGEILEKIDEKKYGRKLKWGSGVSYIIGIIESHIAIHTLAEREEIKIDIFSCRPFSSQQVIKLFVERFQAEKYETNKLLR